MSEKDYVTEESVANPDAASQLIEPNESADDAEVHAEAEDSSFVQENDQQYDESTATSENMQVLEIKEKPESHEDEHPTFIALEVPPISEEEIPEVPADFIHDEDFHQSLSYLKQQLKEEEVQHIDMEQFKINEKDSNDPSYSHLVLPYRVICRQRYHKAGALQRAQFIREIKQHELLQSKALDGVRIHREFCNAIISQPRPEEIIRLTDKQKIRLEWIMKNEIR